MDTESIAYVLEVLAGLVQLMAAGLALSLIRLSGKQVAWMLLTAGLALQVWRRFYTLWARSPSLDLQESITALVVSALLLVGVMGIRRVFIALADTRSRLEHLAASDSLTDLPNRASFLKALDREISRVRRGAAAVVLFADVDGFKGCNDAGGHAFGDGVLCDIASAFREVVRAPDIVARIGGDEFAVVLGGAGPAEGYLAAERLRSAVMTVGRQAGIPLDLSVGMVAVSTGQTPEEIVSAADERMYAAKRSQGSHAATAS